MSIEIIAEVAQGFEGNPKLAELLALGAIKSAADAVKYQLVFADELAIADYPYYDLFKSLEMDEAAWGHIVALVRSENRKIYFDVYGDKSLSLARKLDVSGVKISTTDFYNQPLLRQAIASFRQVFISIGGVAIDELDEFVHTLKKANNVTLMYGFQAEPTPIEENNLFRIVELKKRYPYMPIGFMDHSLGVSEEAFYLPVMAAGLGVSCIEKHITLDPLLQIEDYISALEPARFEKFVNIIRKMEKALGNPELVLTAMEKDYKNKAGKVVVAKRDMQAGEVLKEDDLTLKRVSTDGSPNCFRRISYVLEKTLKDTVLLDCPITKEIV